MSQNNTLSAKAQNIVDNFIKSTLAGSNISKTDVMKHFIITLYAQSPNAKAELLKPFKSCIFHLQDYFTQEEIDILMAELRQVIKYSYNNSDRPYSVYDGYVFNTNDTLEDLICQDPLITFYKTPKYLIDLSMRLSGKRKANEKVYLPYMEMADYALYNPDAVYHVEAICKYNLGEKTTFFEDRYFSFSNLLLDALGIKSEFVPIDDEFTINKAYLSTRPDYVFAFNPMFNDNTKNPFEYAESIWNTYQDVRPMDLASIIAQCAICTKSDGCLDFIFPSEILESKNFWKIMETMFGIKEMNCNATFINLGEIHYAAKSVECFFLHIEKNKGNNGQVRFFDASGSEFHEHNDLKVDALMDKLNAEECNAKYEQRMHYTELTSINNPFSMEKKLPKLGEGAKYVPLGELVEVVEGDTLLLGDLFTDNLSLVKELESNDSLYFARTGYMAHYLSRDYLNCDIEVKKVPENGYSSTAHGYRYIKSPFLVANLHDKETAISDTPIGSITVGRITGEDKNVCIDGVIAFKLKSDIITEAYLLRSLTRDYCSKQISMLADVEHISIGEAFRNNFLDLMIAIPSKETQERRWKEDVERHLNKTHTSLKEAEEKIVKAEKKIVKSAEEFKRDVHMKKHAIGQTLFSLAGWWDMLKKARKEGNGMVEDSMLIGKRNKTSVAEIYTNIQLRIEDLQYQVDNFWSQESLEETQSFSLCSFIEDYTKKYQNPLFKYECHFDAALPDNKMPNVTFPPRALTKVFDDIISNACSHGFENQKDENNIVKIEVSVEEDTPIVTISNNGKPFHEKLTTEDVFTYGSSSKTGQSHFGIGGYEVRNLMREQNGEAEFFSYPEADFPVCYKLSFKDTKNVEH